MATYTERREPLVTCPYNPAHQVKRGRYQIHITKCRKAYPEKDMKHCPFSAEHVVPASDLMHHIYTCPLKTTVERFLTASERDIPSGNTTMPRPNSNDMQHLQEPTEENWDEEATGVSSLEDKIAAPAVAPVFINVQTMTPAERRHYYASLHSVANEQVPADMQPHPARGRRVPGHSLQDMHGHRNVLHPPTTGSKVLSDLELSWRAAEAQYAAADDESDTDEDDSGEQELDQSQIYRMGVGRGYVAAPRAVADSDECEDEEVRSRMQLLGLGRGRPLRLN